MAARAARAVRAVLVVQALDTRGEQEDRGPSAVNAASVEDNISLSNTSYSVANNILFRGR